MAYNEQLTNRVRKALVDVPHVEEKKMFRGITFMVNGKMCVSTGDDELMCRVGPEVYETVLQKEGCRPMVMRGKEMKGYVYVKEDVIQNDKDFKYWIDLALEFNKKVKAAKKK